MAAAVAGRSRRIQNRILCATEPARLEEIKPSLQKVSLRRGQTLYRWNEEIDYLYFVNRGLISLVKTMLDGRTVEVSAIGIEGVTDPLSLFGIRPAVCDTVVQINGSAFRVKRETLARHVESDSTFRTLLQRYSHFYTAQIVQAAACNELHTIEQRCCRWLLIAHDNAMAEHFELTQEFLAMMLGVQRTGVSIAAGALRRVGLIGYSHGRLWVKDRHGLEDGACECYAEMRQSADALFQPNIENPSGKA